MPGSSAAVISSPCQPAALVGFDADLFQPQILRRAYAACGINQQRRANLFAALEVEHDGFVGADGNADYLFIQAQCHADIAHLILERFDNFAIDEL